MATAARYKGRLHEMTRTTPTALWNDSACIQELTWSIEQGAVGATCNPVIVVEVLKKEMHLWKDRILSAPAVATWGTGARAVRCTLIVSSNCGERPVSGRSQ